MLTVEEIGEMGRPRGPLERKGGDGQVQVHSPWCRKGQKSEEQSVRSLVRQKWHIERHRSQHW